MKKILIVEDDSLLRDALQKKLTIDGYEALTAFNGQAGIKRIREIKPDLILLDIVMPKIDGMEVLRQIKKDEELKHIPVIMISNSGQPVEIQKVLELGAVDYLVKADFDPDEVVEKVKKVFHQTDTISQPQTLVRNEASKRILTKAKVLIIEDDQFLKDLIERKLIQAGYQVISAGDGEEGLKMINEEKPVLVLLDILLPSMSGWDVLGKIKTDPTTKKIPVLILTNLGEKEDVEKGLKMGADDYIIKAHFAPNEIIQKVRKCLKHLSDSNAL